MRILLVAVLPMAVVVTVAVQAVRAGDLAMTFDPPGPYDVDAARTLQYAAPEADTLRVCRPVEASGRPEPWTGPRPAVLLIHGGGWDGGTSDIGEGEYTGYSGSWCRLVASWGMVAFSVGYRLQDGSRSHAWPAALRDAQAAVRYVRVNAAALGVDARMVAAWGDSAGGSIALQLGSIGQTLPGDLHDDNAGADPQVQAVVDAFGPWTWGPSSADGPAPASAAQRAVSGGGGRPPAPTLIIQGQHDHIVPPEQSHAAYCFLASHGVAVHFLSYPGDHEYGGLSGATWMPTVGRLQIQAISFLFAQGHRASSGQPPIIPATVSGPGLAFDDDRAPGCG